MHPSTDFLFTSFTIIPTYDNQPMFPSKHPSNPTNPSVHPFMQPCTVLALWRKELRSESRQRYQAECARRYLERQMGAAQVRRELFESADRLRSQAEDRIQRLRDAAMSSSSPSSSSWIRWDGDGANPTLKGGKTVISPLEQLKDHLKIMEQWAVHGRGRDCSMPLYEEAKRDL